MRATTGDDETASRGTAIIVNLATLGVSRERISFRGEENGTITTAAIVTPDRTFELACVYLPSDSSERTTTIDDNIKSTNG